MMNPVPWLQMTNMISYQGLVRTFPKFNAEYFKYGDNAAYVCGDVTYKKNNDGTSYRNKFYVYVEIIDGKLTSNGSAVVIKEDDKAFLEVYKTLCR